MDEHTEVTAETNIASQGEITDRKPTEVAQRENEEQPRLAPDNFARRDRPVLLGTVLLSLAIFLAHCLTPVSHSVWPILVWPFYLIPLMLTGLTRERRYPPILAALCTVLVVLGSFFTSPGLYPLATIFRRAIGVSILWITAVLLVRRIREGEVTREQRDLLSESQRVAHIGNWRYYRTSRITWSDETYRIYGCSPDTFTPNADSFLNLIHPEDRTAMQAWIAACLAGEKPRELEFRAVLPDGRVRIIKGRSDLRCGRNGRPAYIAGTAQDITEQKQAEEALQAVDDRLRRGRMGTFDWDIAHDRLTWSRGLDVLFGAPGQFSGTYEMFAQRVHPGDLPGVNAEIARCMAARDSYACEYRVVWPDGSVHWMASRGEFTFSDAGQALRMRGVVLEITERKQAEAALREREDRYRDLVENSRDLLCTHDLSGRMISCNPAPARILGYTVEEMLRTSMRDFLAPEHRDEFSEYLARVQKDGIAEGLMLVITRTGERRVWEYRNTLRTEGVPVPIVRGMAHDITERHFLENELRQAQKMEAVGRLAGGVAHDFNNILTAIQMNASLLAGGLVPADRLQEKARDIVASADRGAALTRQLLVFGRKQVVEPRILDLNGMLRTLSSLIRGIIPENISVTVSLCDSLGLIKADPLLLEHVIINLVINARDAMPSGGRLTIETSNVDASGHSEPVTRILPPGQYAMIVVSDTGIGMDTATQARIFEPFFTTKRNEGGTGLGLAMSYGTVKQSGGYIFVYSARGQGTTFKILLPTVNAGLKAVATTAELKSIRGRGETILLVEDEDLMRNSTAEFLSAYGYVVLEARNGSEALQLAMSRPTDIAVVVTDMVMPGIDGREVVEILRQLRPQLRAVLMSGYTERKAVEGKEAASFTFLQKPFTAEVLASTLRKVISGG